MHTKSRHSLHTLMLMFTMIAILTSCGDGKDSQTVIIETAIPGVYFEIPGGALPANLDPADISIAPTSPPTDLIKSTDDIDIQAWKLSPEGTQFQKPVRLVMPFEESLPSFVHLSNDDRSWVSDVIYNITPQGHTASVSLEHFSDLVIIMGGLWRQAFEFSAGIPDTQVGELVDAKLTVSMTDYVTFAPGVVDLVEGSDTYGQVVEAPGSKSQVYVVPGSKTVCGPGTIYKPCSVFSDSEHLEPKDIDAFRNAANIHPEILPFEEEFTLGFAGFRCKDLGPAVISFNFMVVWEEQLRTRLEGLSAPDSSNTEIRVDVPFDCVERTAVALLKVRQRVRASAFSREVANNEEVHETIDEEFKWSASEGGPGTFVQDRFHEGVAEEKRFQFECDLEWDPQCSEFPDIPPGIPSIAKVSVPVGLEARADINTDIRYDRSTLVVEGDFYLHAKITEDIDRGQFVVTGNASADLKMRVAIREPSIVEITNCALFHPSKYQQFADYRYTDTKCSFKVDGASSTLEFPSVGLLPGKSLPRVNGSLGGQIIFINLDADERFGEPFEGDFKILIRPDKSEERGSNEHGINDGSSRVLLF